MTQISNFGGSNPDYGVDMTQFGSNLFIMGHSLSNILTNGFYDVFILSVTKSGFGVNWVKYLGTASFNEYAFSMVLTSLGQIYAVG